MWVLIVAPLRAYSSMAVFEASGAAHLLDAPILFLVLHLCIGDTWNTVSRCPGLDRRRGAAEKSPHDCRALF